MCNGDMFEHRERQVTYFWIIAKAVYMVSKGFFFSLQEMQT